MVVGGAPLGEAAGAVVVLHGRGGRATDLMGVAGQVAGSDFALFGPEASHGTWYPHRFTEPNEANEPFLGSAVSVVHDLVEQLMGRGVPAHRIMLLGFSQGACLALECAGRSTVTLGAVVAFSGGLIGATLDETRYRRHYGMGVFLSCAEQDAHIPIERVRQSATMLRGLGAEVVTRLHRGSEHGIHQTDLDDAAQMIAMRERLSLRAS
jgi:predicted esterase